MKTINQIIPKPWGQEEVIEINDKYMMKKLTMHKGHRCSIQYHNQKKETIYVVSGRLNIYLGSSVETLQKEEFLPGETITIVPGQVHRMEAEHEDAVYLEASTPEMDDVVRLVDDYKRN